MALEITKSGIQIEGGIDYPEGKKPYLLLMLKLDFPSLNKINVKLRSFLDRNASDIDNGGKNRESEVSFKRDTLFLEQNYIVPVTSVTTFRYIHDNVKAQIEAANENITVDIIDI